MIKNFIIVVLLGIIVSTFYIVVNQRQKARLLKARVPKMREIDRSEFDKALFELHENRVRAEQEKQVAAQSRPVGTYIPKRELPTQASPNRENDPSTEAQPVQENYPEEYQQQAAPRYPEPELTPEQEAMYQRYPRMRNRTRIQEYNKHLYNSDVQEQMQEQDPATLEQARQEQAQPPQTQPQGQAQ